MWRNAPLQLVVTAVHKDEIDAFEDHQFAKEIEENGKLPFFRLFGKPR